MKPMDSGRWRQVGLVLVAMAALARAETSNPYQSITERNCFSLKPPVVAPVETPTPPPPLAKVVLTGITSIFGESSKRAFFEIEEPDPAKPGAKTIKKPIMREGDREGSVELLSIDLANYSVRIRNGTVETNLAFEEPKLGSATVAARPPTGIGGVPVRPGMPRFGVPNLPRPGIPTPAPSSAAGPIIIPRPGAAGSGAPGTPTASTAPTTTRVTPATTTYRPYPYRSAVNPGVPIPPNMLRR